MRYCSVGAFMSELFALFRKLLHTKFLLKWVRRSDITHFMYRSKKKPKISKQVALSQGELVSEGPVTVWIGRAKRGWDCHPAGRSQSCQISPRKELSGLNISAEVRMSDPDLEKNNTLSTQCKLATVTMIPVPTWGVRASISVAWPHEMSEIPLFSTQSSTLISEASKEFSPQCRKYS